MSDRSTEPQGIQALVLAIKVCQALDALPLNLTEAQWTLLADYLQPQSLRSGDVLIEQGVKDRSVYLVERGTLTVHYEDAKERVRIALVGPGSVLGEGRSSASCRAAPRCRPVPTAACGACHRCGSANCPCGRRRLPWS